MYVPNMELHLIIHLPLLLALVAVEASESNSNVTDIKRAPRSSRRVVRLYSGTRPEPITCLGEGFQSDPVNCAVFYRCLKSSKGRFMTFKFQCAPGTIFDPDTEGCNHPSAVRRSNCGIDHVISKNEQMHDNAIEDFKQEIPSPITTKLPFNTNFSSTSAVYPWSTSSQRQDLRTSFSWLPSTDSHKKLNSFFTKLPVHNSEFTIPFSTSTRRQRSTTPRVTRKATQIGDECRSEGFMGDSENCRKFYRCINNLRGGYIRYEFMCTETTIWDDDIQSCNHAWAVKRRRCGRGNTNDISNEINKNQHISIDYTTSKITPNINAVHNTFLVSKTPESSSFITRIPFTTVVSTTSTNSPTTSNFIIDIRQKDTQTTSKAPDNDIRYINMNTKNESSTSTECSENGFMGDKNDCKKFYRCVDNGKGGYTKYEFSCGEGTVWDANIEACNHAWAVKECEGTASTQNQGIPTTISTQSTPIYTLPSHTTTDDDDDIGYGNQNPTTTTSTTTTISTTTTTTPTSTSTTQITNLPGNQKSCTSSGFMGDKNDCKKFYRCVDKGNGEYIRYDFSCSEGTVWDPDIESCNHPWAVKTCGGDSSSTTKKLEPPTTVKETYTTESIGLTQNDVSDGGYGIQQDESSSIPDDTSSSSTAVTSSSSTTVTTTKQPQNLGNNCKSTGFYGDESDCKKFYRCVDNGNGGFTRYEFTCGEGTVWDSTIESCNHAWAVEKCGGNLNNDVNKEDITTSISETIPSSSSTTTTHLENEIDTGYGQSPSQSPSTTEHPVHENEGATNECKVSGFMPDNKNCKKFYRCVDNGNGGFTQYEFMCGEGTIWDQEIQSCNHDNGRSCKNQDTESVTKEPDNNNSAANTNESSLTTNSIQTSTTTSTESNQNQSPADTANDTCVSEGFYANSKDCKKFYRCVNNGKGGYTKYDFTCGDGTMWVQEIQACDHQNGDCSSQTTKPQQSEEQQSTTTTQGQGQQSSSVTSASTVDSTEKPHDEYQDNSSNTSTQENDDCNSEGFYPNKKDCKKFYRCVDNGQGGYTKYDFTCGEGTAWDTDIQTCNHISEVARCGNGVQEENQNKPMQDEGVPQTSESNDSTTHTTTTESSQGNQVSSSTQSSSDACESEGYFGNEQDCKKFYRCVDNGKGGYTKYDFDCGEGTIWDQDITTCNHPQDVVNPSCNKQSESSSSSSTSTQSSNIDNTSQQTTNCTQENTTKKPKEQNVTCDKAGFYANPNDCKKFYRCVDWDGNGEKFSVYHFECGEGTIWDPSLDTCNHEESVYPARDCSGVQSQNENNVQEQTTESTTTQQSTTEESTTEETTTQSTTTAQESTTQQSTTTESTTTESTTTEKTTQSSTTSESTTTEQQTTTDGTTTQQSTQPTTEGTTTEGTTTQQTTTTQETQSTTSESTTIQQSTTTEETQSTTSENTTTQQTTTTESTESTSSTDKSTTEESTTEQSTTSQTSTTESSTTDSSTTDSTTTESSETQSSTTESSSTEETPSEKECPDTEEDQYLYVCPTSFRRHPKYCNMFYQCTEEDDTHEPKIAVFTCPNNTIYDESKTQCVEESKAEKKCNGQIAQRRRIKRLEPYYKEPIVVGKEKYSCSSAGYYPFEKTSDCSPAFFKCQKEKSGRLRGYVHQCPKGYLYWTISKRCERKENLKDCKTSTNNWSRRWEIPIERKNIAL